MRFVLENSAAHVDIDKEDGLGVSNNAYVVRWQPTSIHPCSCSCCYPSDSFDCVCLYVCLCVCLFAVATERPAHGWGFRVASGTTRFGSKNRTRHTSIPRLRVTSALAGPPKRPMSTHRLASMSSASVCGTNLTDSLQRRGYARWFAHSESVARCAVIARHSSFTERSAVSMARTSTWAMSSVCTSSSPKSASRPYCPRSSSSVARLPPAARPQRAPTT